MSSKDDEIEHVFQLCKLAGSHFVHLQLLYIVTGDLPRFSWILGFILPVLMRIFGKLRCIIWPLYRAFWGLAPAGSLRQMLLRQHSW